MNRFISKFKADTCFIRADKELTSIEKELAEKAVELKYVQVLKDNNTNQICYQLTTKGKMKRLENQKEALKQIRKQV